jgi:dTDP-4-dehydrorhamnose reductase/regulation of enolase protein 1 (concanavalin A-like superfamily)
MPQQSKSLNILLTGASGYLGQHILYALLTAGSFADDEFDSIVVGALYHCSSGLSEAIESFMSSRTAFCSVECQALDITDETAVNQFLNSSTRRWDVCIHAAAMASPKVCQENPSLAMAVNNPTIFFQALQQHNPSLRLVALSTDQVYEGTDPPYRETSPTAPVNVYGATKRAMEDACQQYFTQSVIVLRSSILLGPLAPFVPAHDTFLHFVQNRPPPQQTTYWTDERRNVLAVQDAVQIIMHLSCRKTKPVGVYNMGGPHSYSRMEMAQAVFTHHGYDPSESLQPALKALYQPQPKEVPSPLDISMESAQLMQIFPSRPFQTLEQMILSTFAPVRANDPVIVISGLQDIYDPTHRPLGRLRWRCAPDSWSPASGREGCDGSWRMEDNKLIVYPAAKKDYWRKTYYEPMLLKDDGAVLECAGLNTDQHYTVEAKFDLVAAAQFDQAGIFIRCDPEHWIKTGIEVVDGTPRLSCVVTNEFSDWSTQHWESFRHLTPDTILVQDVEMRVHCRETSFVIEAKMGVKFDFIRIAHLHLSADKFAAGVFACCPEDQKGGFATFHEFRVVEGSVMDHNADGNHEA